jgi:Ankyrin repeats (3 copies)
MRVKPSLQFAAIFIWAVLLLPFIIASSMGGTSDSFPEDAEVTQEGLVTRVRAPKTKLPKPDEHLLHASGQGRIDEIQKALKAGANIHVKDGDAGTSPIIMAATEGEHAAVSYLLSKGSRIDDTSGDGTKNPLLVASYKGHIETVRVLLDKGASLNYVNQRGDSALHLATYRYGPWCRGSHFAAHMSHILP